MKHQDSEPADNALFEKQFAQHKRIPVLEYPPYSSDLAPCDYLFLKITRALRKPPFQSVEEVEPKLADLLNRVTSNELQHSIQH